MGPLLKIWSRQQSSMGFQYEVEVIARDRFDQDVVRVRLKPGKAVGASLEKLATRRTVKTGLLPMEIKGGDIKGLERLAGNGLFYFPRGSRHSDLMAEQAVENFRIQFDNKAAMEEAALWTRLSDANVKKFRDGLTPDGMEIHGMAGWYVRNFMDARDVISTTWREKGIDKTMAQAKEGGGWLVITSEGNGITDLIEAGRQFQRLALGARERNIGIHPMTQSLEETHGQTVIREKHGPGMKPQFMLRVGYVENYPDPVSLRRPVDWFLS